MRLVAHDIEEKAEERMSTSTNQLLGFAVLPLTLTVFVWATIALNVAEEDGGPRSLIAGILAGLVWSIPVGLLAWLVQKLVLALLGKHMVKRMNLPDGWFDEGKMYVYFRTRAPKYRAAVYASYPFMREHAPPRVPKDITWPLEPDSDHGLKKVMATLYREHRQDRYDMHQSVYREVMQLDATAVRVGRDHRDVSALIAKLGYAQTLEVLEQDIPTELALALV